jgi:hypothetical protein
MVRFNLNLLAVIFLTLFYLPSKAQDSCSIEISLLTCSPGEELYSTFGHSAFRVKDRAMGTDIIFNYGTFEFDDPDFYKKFVRGKLLYYVSAQDFNGFREDYRMENRGIIEQQLALDCNDKQSLYQALRTNLLPENKFYKYDFLYDNCSTRLKDILKKATENTVRFREILQPPLPSFRDMIHTYLDAGGKYWSELGIDMLLGNRIDKIPSNEQAMFLPDFLLKGFDSAFVNGKPVVNNKQIILNRTIEEDDTDSWFRPIVVSSLLLLVIGALQFTKSKAAAAFLRGFDSIFFFFLGALGFLMLFMWFGTDHKGCGNNFNLLWAIPFHLPVSLVLYRNKEWIRKYFLLMAGWYFILFFAWSLLPQGMNSAIVPIVIIAFMRSIVRYKKTR